MNVSNEYTLPRTGSVLLAHVNLKGNTEAFQASEVYSESNMDGKYLLYIQIALIALYSGYSLGLKSYSPFSKPSKNNKLVVTGFYKYVRHPIYSSVMIVALVLLLSNPSFPSFVIFAVLIYIQDIKASFEEESLTRIHLGYTNYKKTTKKFIPFVY